MFSADESKFPETLAKYPTRSIPMIEIERAYWHVDVNIREFKIYDATVAKMSLKIASSSFAIYFAIMSVCLTFES